MTRLLALAAGPVLDVGPTPWSAGDPLVAPPPLTRFLAASPAGSIINAPFKTPKRATVFLPLSSEEVAQ